VVPSVTLFLPSWPLWRVILCDMLALSSHSFWLCFDFSMGQRLFEILLNFCSWLHQKIGLDFGFWFRTFTSSATSVNCLCLRTPPYQLSTSWALQISGNPTTQLECNNNDTGHARSVKTWSSYSTCRRVTVVRGQIVQRNLD
jgi:hypothetical protein